MDLGNIAQQIISTLGNFINSALAIVIRLFDSLFNFLPANLRTGVGVLAFIVLAVIFFFLWRRD
jgi:hypothetical protein